MESRDEIAVCAWDWLPSVIFCLRAFFVQISIGAMLVCLRLCHPIFPHLQEQDSNFLANLCKQLCFSPYLMRIRAKEEFVLDEKRMKCGAMRLEKINFKKESNLLLQEISRYTTMSQGIPA